MMKRLFKNILNFFHSLTPSGKDKKYYDLALQNMHEGRILTKIERRALNHQIKQFVFKATQRRNMTPIQISSLVNGKFRNELQAANLFYDVMKGKCVDA